MTTTSTSSTGAINFGGLASGLDTTSIISTLVAAESVPLTALQTKGTNVASASSTVSSFSSSLSALADAATALSTASGFNAFSATSSAPSAVVATTTGNATAGSYDISVTQLAKAQRTYSDPQASSTDPLGMSGTLNLTVGSGTAIPITITSGESLTDIAAAISSSGARVSASVVYDGSQYRLQVAGLDTGAANAITFGESGTSLGLSTAANTYQGAQDAQMTVDGISVTRPTNQIIGVIPGVTLALTGTTSSTASVNVASDPTTLTGKIQTFVSAYNAAVSALHFATGYGSTTASNTVLQNDPAMRSAMDQITSVLDQIVPGSTGKYTTLGSVGIELQNDGSLLLDSSKLSAAVADDPTSVSKLFVTDSTNGSNGIMSSLASTIQGFTADSTSLLSGRIASLGTESKNLTDQETKMQTRIDAYQATLQKQFAAMELIVQKYKTSATAIDGMANLPGFTYSSGK
ncbi:MAG: flagellar filament capping protein FliD [Polyangiaceae bacterium]